MKKYMYPPFLTLVATIIAGLLNNAFGWVVDIELATGALVVIGNYLFMQFAVDIRKLKSGELPTGSFNSMKLITTALVCVALGLTNYFKLDISTELIVTWSGIAMTIITGKGIKDIIQVPKKEGKGNDDTQHYGDSGPAV